MISFSNIYALKYLIDKVNKAKVVTITKNLIYINLYSR